VTLGTPQHDPSAAETLSADPQLRWRVRVSRATRGAPAVGEAVLAVGTADRQLVLVYRPTGQVLWRAHLKGPVRGGPLLARNRVYVATEASPDALIYALNLRDGRAVWSLGLGNTPGTSVVAPLALDGDTLYAAMEGGVVLRLATRDGAVVWRHPLPGPTRAAPVPTPDGIAIATADTLFLLDRRTGEVLRRMGTRGSVLASPALGAQSDRMFLGTSDGHLLAVALPAFTVLWDVNAGDGIFGSPAVARDTVYALARNGRLWMVPADDPTGARSFPLDIVAITGPNPLAAGGGVLVAGIGGEVLLIDTASGVVRWRVEADGPIETPPLLRNGELVVVGGRGDIHDYR
jgi:outer membrane protein assembly factor BamB